MTRLQRVFYFSVAGEIAGVPVDKKQLQRKKRLDRKLEWGGAN